MVATSRSRTSKVQKTLNQATGKESTHERAFSEINWGEKTKKYRNSLEKFGQDAIADIFSKAAEHYRDTKRKANKALEVIDVDKMDERELILED